MAMSLRVVVPPHPLIGHWLTMLRHRDTPPALYATALQELGLDNNQLTGAIPEALKACTAPHKDFHLPWKRPVLLS